MRSGPVSSRSASIRTHPLSNRVRPVSTAITTTANPTAGARVGPVGGGGGGFGFLERRWLLTAGGEPPVAVTSSAGNRMVQLSGRSRLGASRMATSCLACWRMSTSPLRLKARAMAKACSSWPWPIQEVIISKRNCDPSGVEMVCTSARGVSSSRAWP